MLMKYIKVHYEPQAERYLRDDTGDEVRFTRQVALLFQQEEITAKLSYTRAVDGVPTKQPVPCVRIDGDKFMLDHEDIEVADDCLVAVVVEAA